MTRSQATPHSSQILTLERLLAESEARYEQLQAAADTRQALINVQLGQYPDSRIMSLCEVYSEWMDDDGDVAEWKANFEAYYGRVYRDPVEKRNQLCDYIIKQRQDYKLRVARSLALCLQNKINVFYECGLITGGRNEDGSQEPSRYQWRGCRYGTEPHEYTSGFGKD